MWIRRLIIYICKNVVCIQFFFILYLYIDMDYEKKYLKYLKKIELLNKKKSDNDLNEKEMKGGMNEELNWSKISDKIRKSVVQIISITYETDYKRPYLEPPDGLARGSGFIIYSTKDKLLIMTNAHVVEDARFVLVRTEQTEDMDLKGNVIGICFEKDLAIIELEKDEIEKLMPLPESLEFDDDRDLDDTTPVLVSGYPLGEKNIKVTTGVISGNQVEHSIEFDRDISYMQISAAVNPGNSGGPLFNKYGKVIGVNSAGIKSEVAQNVSYAIPTHVILSVFNELVKSEDKIIRPLVNDFMWNNTNNELIQTVCGEDISGIYIYDATDDNFLKLKKKDILIELEIQDICGIKDIFKLLLEEHDENELYDNADKIVVKLDNKGSVKLLKNNDVLYSKRKLSLSEVIDSIVINSNVKVKVCRDKEIISYDLKANTYKNDGIKLVFPEYEKIDYEICLGCCFTPLTKQLILNRNSDKLEELLEEMSKINPLEKFLTEKYKKKSWICISNIFPNTPAYDTYIIDSKNIDIINKINGKKIRSMDKLRNILLDNKNKYISIEFENGKMLVISDIDSNARIIDKQIYQEHNIKILNDFTEKWLDST